MRRDFGIEWGLQSAEGKCFQFKKKKKREPKSENLCPRFRDSLPWGNWWEKDQGLVTKQRPSYQKWDRKWELGWSWVTRSEQEQQLWPGAESLWPDAESVEDRPDWTQAWGHRWKSGALAVSWDWLWEQEPEYWKGKGKRSMESCRQVLPGNSRWQILFTVFASHSSGGSLLKMLLASAPQT